MRSEADGVGLRGDVAWGLVALTGTSRCLLFDRAVTGTARSLGFSSCVTGTA